MVRKKGLMVIEDRKPVVVWFSILIGTLCASYRFYLQSVDNEGVAKHIDFDPQGPRFQSVEFSYQIWPFSAVSRRIEISPERVTPRTPVLKYSGAPV
jgi:hypothetical protein